VWLAVGSTGWKRMKRGGRTVLVDDARVHHALRSSTRGELSRALISERSCGRLMRLLGAASGPDAGASGGARRASSCGRCKAAARNGGQRGAERRAQHRQQLPAAHRSRGRGADLRALGVGVGVVAPGGRAPDEEREDRPPHRVEKVQLGSGAELRSWVPRPELASHRHPMGDSLQKAHKAKSILS